MDVMARLRAGAVDELTPVGKKVLDEMTLILNDTEGRWGELTSLGAQQHRQIAKRMMQRFPEVFEGAAHVNAQSTVAARCVVSMGYSMLEMSQINPQLQITMRTSKRDQDYMNHQDPHLRKNTRDSEGIRCLHSSPHGKQSSDGAHFLEPRHREGNRG